jgi:hypothetical protein
MQGQGLKGGSVNAMEESSTHASDDAQRDLERRALRNVRSLVDNLQNRDRIDGRRSLRLLAVLLAGTALVVGLGYGVVRVVSGPPAQREITTTVPKAAETPRVTPR